MKNTKGHLYLLLAFFLAGTSVITGRILATSLGSFTITVISLGLMLLCLFPFYVAKTLYTVRLLKTAHWTSLFCQALFGIFLFRILLLTGIHFTSTVEAGILTGATPAITTCLAWFCLKETFSGKTVLGIFCTVAGIILLQNTPINSNLLSLQHTAGNLLVLGAAASESIFNVISRKQKKGDQQASLPIHPLVQTLLVAVIAGILCLIPALEEKTIPALQSIGWQGWAALVWYGLFVTALAFVCFYEGVTRCDTYTTAAFSGLIPLTSLLCSVLLLDEPITSVQWLGSFLVIVSILLIAGKEKAAVNPRKIAN